MVLYRNENRWDDLIVGPAAAETVPIALVKAIIGVESGFAWIGDPHPVTGRIVQQPSDLDRQEPRIGDASSGVMQLLLQTARWVSGNPQLTRDVLYDPADNILLGTQLLGAYLAGWRPGDGGVRISGAVRPFTIEEAAAAYNGGEGVVTRRAAGVGTFSNQTYVNRAMTNYGYFSGTVTAPAVAEPGPPPGTPPESPLGASGTDFGALGAVGLLLAVGLTIVFSRR